MFYRGAASRCRRRPPSTATTIAAAAAAPRFVLAGLRSSSTPAVATSSPSSIALSSSVAPARRTYTFRARRSDDDDGGRGGGTIDPTELNALNATSAKLYRLMLRSSRSLCSVDDGDGRRTEEEGEVRLQVPLDPRDYGRARLIDCRPRRSSSSAAMSGDGKTDEAETTTAATKSLWNFVEGRLKLEGPSNSESAFVRRRFADLAGSDAADGSDADSDGSDDEEEGDASMATTSSDVRSAIRRSFFRLDDVGDPSSSSSPLTKRDVVEMHRLAISTLRVIHEQIEMMDRTSVSTDERRGLKVIATSQCIGKTASSPRSSDDETAARYRFAYRIRIENVGRRARKCDDDANDDTDGTKHKEGDVQLLGRTWKIEEDGEAGEVVHVDAPKTGAVGHHPVILPGQAFEYMSGCELQTKTGRMSGKFHMASVDGGNTFSAMVGDVVEALDESDDENDDDDSKKFELAVKPFRLVASDE